MARFLFCAAVLFLPLLATGCIQRTNIVYPQPPERTEAYVVVPPTITPQQESCLEGFASLLNDGATVAELREWERGAQDRPGCSELRLQIHRPGAAFAPQASNVPLPERADIHHLLVETSAVGSSPRLHAIAGDPPRPPEPKTVTIDHWHTQVLTKTLIINGPPVERGDPCPDGGSCQPAGGGGGGGGASGGSAGGSGGGDGTVLGYGTTLLVGGGVAYALCYLHILGIPGAAAAPPLSSPGAPGPDDVPAAEAQAATEPMPDALVDPRVRVRSAQFEGGTGWPTET